MYACQATLTLAEHGKKRPKVQVPSLKRVGTTGQAVEPRPCHAGRPKRKHFKPIRFLDTIEVSLPLIGQTGA